MRILGKATNNDLIIQISSDEWEALKNEDKSPIEKPFEILKFEFGMSEVGKFFKSHKGLKGEASFMRCVFRGEFPPTLVMLKEVAEGRLPLRYLGPVGQAKLKEALEMYEIPE